VVARKCQMSVIAELHIEIIQGIHGDLHDRQAAQGLATEPRNDQQNDRAVFQKVRES